MLIVKHCSLFNQAPDHSTLELSSDSEPSPVGSPSKEERSDCEDSPLHKSLNAKTVDDDDNDENLGKILGESGANSPSSKRSKLKSPRKAQKTEDEKPPEKNKSYSRKRKTGKRGYHSFTFAPLTES